MGQLRRGAAELREESKQTPHTVHRSARNRDLRLIILANMFET